jgi:hypothetical protein
LSYYNQEKDNFQPSKPVPAPNRQQVSSPR